jgi:hypothetical protein
MATPRDLMVTFSAWSAASLVGGGALWAAGPTPVARAFGRQTFAWGVINAAIAGVSARRPQPDPGRLRTILLVNCAADLGYMAVGAWVLSKEKYRGDGAAVILQGAYLLAQDAHFAYHLDT